MSHLKALGSSFRIPIPYDEHGFLGRECPDGSCGKYFKIQPGTGLKGENLPFRCPYCGHTETLDKFATRAQLEYAKSVVVSQMMGAVLKDFKELEFDYPPRGMFGIGLSMKVTGSVEPVKHYQEKQLETEIICEHCTLRSMIYGVFGFCPDCGVHNSLQILKKNLELVGKMLALSEAQEQALAQVLVANCLEDCVSAFDGFGREACRVFAAKAIAPAKAEAISFQNILAARDKVRVQFIIDFATSLDAPALAATARCFQKRHLLAHKMGVIDDGYVAATSDPAAVLGRKVSISPDEVRSLTGDLSKLGDQLFEQLSKK